MILSLVLYGSRARGDFRTGSDVDLLGVTEGGRISSEAFKGGASLYHYPLSQLQRAASSGDLFIYHLVSEGVVLHDTADIFHTVKENFVLKDNYVREVEEASIILEFFRQHPSILGRKSARKRLVWAIRTILIARSAETAQPRFSSSALERFSSISGLKFVIDNRNEMERDVALMIARKVMDRFGVPVDIKGHPSTSRAALRSKMREAGGIVRDTLKFIQPQFLTRGRPRLSRVTAAQSDEIFYPD